MTQLFLNKFEKYDYPLFGWVRLPEIVISDIERAEVDAPIGCSNYDFLRKLCYRGYKTLCPDSEKEEWIARIKKELDLLQRLGYVDYMLLVWKVINEADKAEIARGPGRGSVAGSLVAYLTRITDVQPIKYKLFFERFVSEARSKKKVVDGITYIDGSLAPDIDVDIEQKRRHEVVEKLNTLYPNRVSKISNVATMSGKALIKMCGKTIAEINEEEMKMVSDFIPKKYGVVADLKDSYYGKKDENDEWEQEPVDKFIDWCDKYPKVFNIALKLRGLIKNKSSHASGYVISFRDLDEYMPLEYAKKKKENSDELLDEKEIVCSFTMEDVAYLTIKLDLLGLRCASVISDVIKNTGLDLTKVNLDSDPLIYDSLQDLKAPHGLFQIEASTNLQVCREVKPKNLSELSDVLAMARPGALAYVKDYVAGTKECPHELFKDILGPSRNVCLYQEQMMQLLHAIGFSLEEAEKVRRIVGKKKIEEMVEWQGKVKEMAEKNGFSEEIGAMVWKILDDSASYSFNRSHSLSYATLSATTIYLKHKYPQQFYCSLLKQANDEPKPLEEIAKIHNELKNFGIKLLPPHLLKSDIEFKIEGKDIRFGLSSIKGISDKVIEKLMKFRQEFMTKFEMFNAAKESGLSIGILCSLIYSGCMDTESYNKSRARLALEAQLWNCLTDKEKKLCFNYGKQFDYDVLIVVNFLKNTNDSKGKPFIKESRFETIKKKYEPHKEIYEKNKNHARLTAFHFERMLIGYAYSTDLWTIFKDQAGVRDLMSIQECLDSDDGNLEFVGVIEEEKSWTSKKGNKCIKLKVSDGISFLETIISNNANEDKIETIKNYNQGDLPKENDIIHCLASKSKGSIYMNKLAIQNCKIYSKYLDLKKDKENDEKIISENTPK